MGLSEPPFRELGDLLRHARETAGMTQQEAAASLGTTQAQIHRYESGKREAPRSWVRRAEALYRVPVEAGAQQPEGVARETERISTELPQAEAAVAFWFLEELGTVTSVLGERMADIARRARRRPWARALSPAELEAEARATLAVRDAKRAGRATTPRRAGPTHR